MNRYVLDTDHISLQQRGVEPLFSRVNALPPEAFVVTAVSIEEIFRGRLAQIKQARKEEEQLVAYRWLIDTTRWINSFSFAEYDTAASHIFTSLQRQRVRIGTMDLRIAAITLSIGGILLTRNVVDFGKVSGLSTQDWTV